MKPHALHPPMDPPNDPPEPDLSSAMPCVCGVAPEWERQHGRFRLFCFRNCVDSGWLHRMDNAIESWNEAVEERKEQG